MKISISEARKLGIAPLKGNGKRHYADIARENGKNQTALKKWKALAKRKG